MQALGEGRAGPHEDVAGRRESPESLVGPRASPQGRGDVVGDDHEQIVVAVRASRASRARAEEIDALGPVGLDEAARDLAEGRVVEHYGERAAGLRGIGRHGSLILAASAAVNPVPKWCHLGVWFGVHSNHSANSAIGGQRRVTVALCGVVLTLPLAVEAQLLEEESTRGDRPTRLRPRRFMNDPDGQGSGRTWPVGGNPEGCGSGRATCLQTGYPVTGGRAPCMLEHYKLVLRKHAHLAQLLQRGLGHGAGQGGGKVIGDDDLHRGLT
jgi:hypothetical protein